MESSHDIFHTLAWIVIGFMSWMLFVCIYDFEKHKYKSSTNALTAFTFVGIFLWAILTVSC